ncbi:MAG: glycosyltransferase [Deltaproteobacteria bacterium]|nr:glycosyltransferase [Deltaproteobacteria bacterium]
MNVSVVIATLHREEDLRVLLDSFLLQTKSPCEILIIDQSDDENTEKLCMSYERKLPLKYLHSAVKSGTHSRNMGIQKSKGHIVAFLDDDTKLLPDYIEQIEAFYKEFPQAIGGMGKIINYRDFRENLFGKGALPVIYKMAASFFGLNSFRKGFILLKSSRNIECYDSDQTLEAEWLSGLSWYKREIFSEFTFEEKFDKWSFGEDRMLSYRIFKKYPGSLYFYPKAGLYHFESDKNRLPEKNKILRKTVYQYWFSYSSVDKNRFFYWWGNLGEILLHLLNAVIMREPLVNTWYYIKANTKLILNLKKIQAGHLKSIGG